MLTAEEVNFIREVNKRKFERYVIYTKFYCGYTNNNTDFTGAQFLAEFDYSTKQDNDCSIYNKQLIAKGLLKIECYRDCLGHKRNKYYWLNK